MTAVVDRIGHRYGLWTVIARDTNAKKGVRWICRCACGREKSLRSVGIARSKNCGCSRAPSSFFDKFPDLSGKRFGALVVIGKSRPQKHILWECICDCGEVRHFNRGSLQSGHRTSCGCRMNMRRHDMSRSPEYSAWNSARERCTNPNNPKYPIYGGRGISMSQEWANDFAVFLKDMGPRPRKGYSLERKNGDGNYDKDNCVWATILEQNNNTKNNTLIDVEGEIMSVANASRITGINYRRLLKAVVSHKRMTNEDVVCLRSINI